MSITESESRVLAGIIPSHSVRMEQASLRNLGADNFSNPNFKIIWKSLAAYFDEHMHIVPRWVFSADLDKAGHSSAKKLELLEMFDIFTKVTISDHEFKAAINFLKEDEATRMTKDIIVSAHEILNGEYFDPETERVIKGQEEARAFLSEGLQKLESTSAEYAPEGSVKDDIDMLYQMYLEKEANPEQAAGIKFGIPEVDECTGGVRPGELVLVAGFTASGKSQLATNLAWNAMQAGHNVLMFTTETTREEMEIRVLSRHSRLAKFKNPGGLDSHEIMSGTLKGRSREVFREVLEDFKSVNPGELFMVQMPSNGFSDYVYAKAAQYNRIAPIDLIIIDSINLLRSPRRYPSKREMLEDLLQDTKRFASSFDSGRGVAVVSPWQMSRTAWQEAREAGGVYTLASLADSSEAEKCVPLDGRVLTMSGFKEIKDVVPGDSIVGSSGLPQTVLDWIDNGVRPIYEVTTSDDVQIECTPGHIWTVKEKGQFVNRTTQELMDLGGSWEIPVLQSQPDFHGPGLVVGKVFNPTILGWALACAESNEHELVVIPKYTHTLTAHLPFPNYVIRDAEGVEKFVYHREELEEYLDPMMYADLVDSNLFGAKDPSGLRIPTRYLNSSHHVREALVRAFMDDSQKNLHKPKVSFKDLKGVPLDHPGLGGSLKYLVASLGWPLEATPRKIVSVRDTGKQEPTACITVSNDDGLFVTSGFVLTHNSSSKILTLFKEDGERMGLQVLKNRGGVEMAKISVPYDYRNSYFGSSSEASAGTTQAPGTSQASIVRDITSMMGS